MPFASDLKIRQYDAKTWMLMESLVYNGERETFIVPVGYVTDFASVPRSFQWLVSPYGVYTRAAILHDYLITDQIPYVSSRDVDGIFRRVMREAGVSASLRWTMWAAVRVGALFSKHRAPGREFKHDAPAVLGIGLLVAITPFIAPAALFVAVTLGFLKMIGVRR